MPRNINFLISLIILLGSTSLYAQKIKYKDIFPLLDAKNYDEGIPQLRSFLSNPKNQDEANAQLQMGLYFEELVNKYDLINDSTDVLQASDSSVKYLALAKTLITEKELKKNDDYYQAFHRRDLRTGEFGIKLSDVHLDIEKKLQRLRAIIKYGKEIYANLYVANAANSFCFDSYKKFTESYSSENSLKLMAGEEQIDILSEMSDREADLREAFSDIRAAVSRIGKKGYSPELEFNELNKFGEDGLSEVDIYQNDVLAWEYGEWAYRVKQEIEGDVAEMKGQLVALDKKLKAENERLKGLEIFPFDELTHVVDAKLVKQLKSFDEKPLPLTLYSLQIKKNEYDFIIKPDLNARLANEEDVDYQLAITDSLVSVLDEIEEDVQLLQEDYIMEGKAKYGELVNDQYNGDFGLIKLRKSYEEFLQSARAKWREKNEFFTIKSKWGVSADGADSIYLSPDSLYKINNRKKYFSMITMRDDSSNIYVLGLDRSTSREKGFMAMVSNARVIQWKETFDIGKFSYGGDSTELIIAKFIPAQDTRIAAYMYSPAKDAKVNLVVSNAKKVGQIAWANRFEVRREPVSVKFNDLVKETIVYMMTEEEMENMTSDETAYYVIDRAGSVR